MAAMLAAWFGAFAGIAGFGLVLPVLMLAPSLRRLPYWLAASWGAGIAILWVLIVMGTRGYSGPIGIVLMAASVGAVAGVTDAIAARVPMRFQQRV